LLYNVDDLISELRQPGYGLHIGYLLIGSTLMTLQLINICNKYGMQWDIRFNPQKSQLELACFGGNSPRDNIITLGDVYLCWSLQIKYLGCCFTGKECAVDPSSFIGRFYGTFNNILNVMGYMGNSRNEMSAMYLIQTYCLPRQPVFVGFIHTVFLSSGDIRQYDSRVRWEK